MRFQYRCEMSTCDPSFLLSKKSARPLENYATDFHGGVSADLPFSYPGALEEFYQGHLKHQNDKQKEAGLSTSMKDFVEKTHSAQLQGHSFGSLALATHVSYMKSGYYASDTIKGMSDILEYLSETTIEGCNFFRLLQSARADYEEDMAKFSDSPATLTREVSGLQYWRAIHGHTILVANRSYTMHAVNLNVFEEMLTSSCGQHFGNGQSWDSFGWYIQITDGGGLWEFLMIGRESIICMYNRKTTSSGLDSIICGGFDDLMSWAGQVMGSSDTKNRRSRNILRTTAVGIERMPKVRVTESGEVGEPPDASIRYLTLTMTEMRHMTADILDALLRLLFRDRRGKTPCISEGEIASVAAQELCPENRLACFLHIFAEVR
jgi:hypothetical protein